ncbi:MAG: amidophosphoribosyltransferase, partial [Clostridiales bacterium]|nr:amidophosphoribosyltransferase [Clostridiales bacterium]
EQANSQPLVMHYVKGTMALAANGCLVNGTSLRAELQQQGAIFQTNNSVEIISYLIAKSRIRSGRVERSLDRIMPKLAGAYSLVIMTPRKLVAARDPQGFRPLCIGMVENSYVICSESCAVEAIGGRFLRDVEPGEIVIVDRDGLRSIRTHCGQKTALCIFEHIYFARPDSVIDTLSVHRARYMAGELLSKARPVEADVVIGVPDSGLDAAYGYADASGIPYEIGFIKNRYVGRTFIQTTQGQRTKSVAIKLNPISSVVEGKRVVLVDDSIVRGTTSRRIISLLRRAGAREVHMRISSPPFTHPCYFGTDISNRKDLVANNLTVAEIGTAIGADSLCYLGADALKDIASHLDCGYCDGCFTGRYPIQVDVQGGSDIFDEKLDSLVKRKG